MNNLARGSITLAITLWVLGGPAIAAQSSATIQLASNDSNNCQLTATGDGTTHLIRNCDVNTAFFRAIELPSTTTVTLTDKDCSESTDTQKWWVRLEAKALVTSTVPPEGLNVTNILNSVRKYISDPQSDVYLGPYLKITGAELKGDVGNSETVGCAVMRLPVTAEGRANQVKVEFLPEQSGQNVLQGCGNNFLFKQYFPAKNGHKYGYIQQCMRLTDANNNPFEASQKHKQSFKERASPSHCPDGQAISGMFYWNPRDEFYIECSSLYNPTTQKTLKVLSPADAGRKIRSKDHILICEKPNSGGPGQLIWRSSSVMTGWDVDSDSHQAWCANYSLE